MVYKSEDSERFGGHASGSRAHDLRERLSSRASTVKHQVQDRASRAKDWFGESMEEYPLLMGGAFILLGLAAGFAIPETTRERRVIGRTRDTIMSHAQDVGSRIIEKGEDVAGRAVQAMRSATQRPNRPID